MLNQMLPIFIKFRCSLGMDRLGVRSRKRLATDNILISCYVQFLITECLTINYKRVHKKLLSSGGCRNCTGLAASALCCRFAGIPYKCGNVKSCIGFWHNGHQMPCWSKVVWFFCIMTIKCLAVNVAHNHLCENLPSNYLLISFWGRVSDFTLIMSGL